MKFFDRLEQETQAQRQELLSTPIIQRALEGQITLQEYTAFLGQAFHHVKHTVPLLMATGARLAPRHNGLRHAVAEYIEEEIGHEEWILSDIRACGEDADAVRAAEPLLPTELMVSYAYDLIERVDPLGFFGMVHVLEGTSVSIADQAADRIRENLGLPKKAFSYLYSHGALDVEHVAFFKDLMNRIEAPAEQARIVHSARVFYHLYGGIFRALESPAVTAIAA